MEMTRLKTMLDALFRKHGLVGLKGGTEVEDMTFEEICYLKKLGEPDLPLIVKIGGPEARNDIRMLKSIAITGYFHRWLSRNMPSEILPRPSVRYMETATSPIWQ
jgi:hypothetical protein